MDHDADFEAFCKELEALKGQATLFRPRKALTQQILNSIQEEKKHKVKTAVANGAPSAIIAAMLFALWYFFQHSPNHPL